MKTAARDSSSLCEISKRACRFLSLCVAILGIGLMASALDQARAQSPAILWSTNVGATLFAVDAQTNTYANSGGTVIKFNGAGVPLQTNAICPLPGIARRDTAGNYYFAGTFSGTQDFGGIVLSVQFNSSCYLAKYSSGGALFWVTNYGPNNIGISVTDLAVDGDGNSYVGHTIKLPGPGAGTGFLGKVTATGAIAWDVGFPDTFSVRGVKVWPTSATNCLVQTYVYGPFNKYLSMLWRGDAAGDFTLLHSSGDLTGSSNLSEGRPVCDGRGRVYVVEPGLDHLDLAQFDTETSAIVWKSAAAINASWALNLDWLGGVYVAHNDFPLLQLSRYDSDGHRLWTTDTVTRCTAAISDAYGNLFTSFDNGPIMRFAAEPTLPPVITNLPAGGTVFAGTTTALSVGVAGSSPLTYAWQLQGTNLPAGTSATLTLSNVNVSQSGLYSVIVTNVAGAATSSPVLLRVKSVQFYYGSQLLTNGTYTFPSPPTLSVHSAFAGGSTFYSLDGSAPSFASTLYSGPFVVSQSATVRALGYSSDFLQSEEADAVTIVVLENHTLTASASVGGSVTLNPPGGLFLSTSTVSATATPALGWSFLYWLGDASGTNPVVNLSMERNKTIQAVFGTALSTTVAGGGQVQLFPPGGLYPYGTAVRLTGIPDPGNVFGFWGNAATGNTNPLLLTITAPTQTVSSIFGVTPVGQAALTVLLNGHGRVNISPRANAYVLNQSVSLTAVPDAGQTFLSWSGDASGSQNPLPLTMTAAKVITANFTARPALRVDRPGLEGLTPAGFRLTLVSDPTSVYQLFGSTNLTAWNYLATITNLNGELQFTDPTATNASEKFYKATP